MTNEPAPDHSRLAQLAVGTASIAAGLVVATIAALGLIALFGGRIEDNWVGMVGVVGVLTGLAGSAVAFLMAVAARLKHDHWTGLRLPITLFPVLLLLLVLGETFWWE